jgi:ribonuclease D
MWASRILGWPAHGLAALLKAHFGVTLNKRYQLANWGLRPLPPAQLDYARLDTHYLLPLQAIQAQELEALGRWPQARHRFTKLTATRSEPKHFDPDDFWRMSGVRGLDDVVFYGNSACSAISAPALRTAPRSKSSRTKHFWA